MTTARPTREATLSVGLDLDQLAKVGSALALGTAILATAGVLSVVAYLSAWNVPAPLVRLDPLTAALRSDAVLSQVVTLGVIVFGTELLVRRLPQRRRTRAVVGVGAIAGATLVAIGLLSGGYLGPTLAIAGGVGLALLHQLRGVPARPRLVAFAAIALLSAFQTGAESGRLVRDVVQWQTPVVLTSRVPVGGLAGGVEAGGAWQYRELYLVFRDGEAVYVSRPGAGPAVWIVPAMQVMSLGIGVDAA